MYNNYKCCYYRLVNGKLYKNSNEACWRGILKSDIYPNKLQSGLYWGNKYLNNRKYVYQLEKDYNTFPKCIYIDYLCHGSNVIEKKYINKIVNILNKITNCRIVKINARHYISYRLINNNTYGANLLLLNIIRMIWYKPNKLHYDTYWNNILKYDNKEDPLKFILKCIKLNIDKNNSNGAYGNHSCVYSNIKLKTKEDLYKYNGKSMENFLTI